MMEFTVFLSQIVAVNNLYQTGSISGDAAMSAVTDALMEFKRNIRA